MHAPSAGAVKSTAHQRAVVAIAVEPKPCHDACLLLLQVLKGSLSVHQPTIMCDGFVYEEGDDLDEDEMEANAANLPKMLQALPGTVFLRQRLQAAALTCCCQ